MRRKLATLCLAPLILVPVGTAISCSEQTISTDETLYKKITDVFKSIKGVSTPYVSEMSSKNPSSFVIGNITPYELKDFGIEDQIALNEVKCEAYVIGASDSLGTIDLRLVLSIGEGASLIQFAKNIKITGFYSTKDVDDERDLATVINSMASRYNTDLETEYIVDFYNNNKANTELTVEDLGITNGFTINEDGEPVELDMRDQDWLGSSHKIQLLSIVDQPDRGIKGWINIRLTVTKGSMTKHKDMAVQGFKTTFEVNTEILDEAAALFLPMYTTTHTGVTAESLGSIGAIVSTETLGITIETVPRVRYQFRLGLGMLGVLNVDYTLTLGSVTKSGIIIIGGFSSN